MEITATDRSRIAEAILDKYEKVARSPEGQFRYPTGRAGLLGQGYDMALADRLPPEVQASFCGVGNPLSLGRPSPGQAVLDIGSGAGVDTLLAALLVAPGGSATGIEFSPAMVARARENKRASSIGNASFVEGSAESLPFADGSFDLVISSGVLNLVVDKDRALAEAWRVLRPGGRLQVADQVMTGPEPASPAEAVASWFR